MSSWLITNYGEKSFRPDTENGLLCCSLRATSCQNREAGWQAIGVATLHPILVPMISGIVAESAIELHQCVRRKFLILK